MFGAGVTVKCLVWSLFCDRVVSLQIPLRDKPKSAVTPVSESGIETELNDSEERPRKLHGRFLQVTDFHPDRFYEVYSSTSQDAACHRDSGPAGYYGAETSECDTPLSLVNATFDWIKAEVKDTIDFVIWTGDSARHDNDEQTPRSVEQVVGLNEFMVQKFVDVFGKPDNEDDEDPTNDLTVPIIPTFGNNDILPHNIFDKGPNHWTKRYLGIWRKFIPEAQRHQFEQGGWFNVEVIPSRLVVFSLNSLYFFDSNSAVDGCAAKSEPGYRQLEWMRIQLQFIRDRQMKAIIIGHVPPARTESKQSWDETCWQKYTLWMRQYRDVIVGSMYGHMNTDHFMLQDFQDIDKDVSNGYELVRGKKRSIAVDDEPVDALVSANYLIELRDLWSKLPQPPSKKSMMDYEALQRAHDSSGNAGLDWQTSALIDEINDDTSDLDTERKRKKKKNGGKKKKPHSPRDYLEEIGGVFGERFSLSFASPSVVPNYFPTIRIYEYNITGLSVRTLHPQDSTEETHIAWQDIEDPVSRQYLETMAESDARIARKKKKHKKARFHLPEPPSSSAPPGPAYSPQSLSLLGYTQYYANLTRINNDFLAESNEREYEHAKKWKEGKHHGQKPHDKDHTPHPKKFKYEILYDTRNDSVYNLTDMTMRAYIDLAQRIGNFKSGGKKSDVVTNDDDVADEDDSDNEDLSEAGKKKKKKHHKKKHGKKRKNEAWLTFVRRAFVATMDDEDIEESFS